MIGLNMFFNLCILVARKRQNFLDFEMAMLLSKSKENLKYTCIVSNFLFLFVYGENVEEDELDAKKFMS